MITTSQAMNQPLHLHHQQPTYFIEKNKQTLTIQQKGMKRVKETNIYSIAGVAVAKLSCPARI
jgi:hypothetical protein